MNSHKTILYLVEAKPSHISQANNSDKKKIKIKSTFLSYRGCYEYSHSVLSPHFQRFLVYFQIFSS